MNDNINLISDKRKEALRRERSIKISQRTALFSLITVVIISAILFFFIQNTQLNGLAQKEKNDSQTLSFLQQKILKLFYLDERLKSVDSLIKSRTALENIISQVTQGLPQNASIDSFGLNKQEMSITISANSLTPINQFLNFLMDKAAKKELVKQITISSITVDPKYQKYILSVVAQPL